MENIIIERLEKTFYDSTPFEYGYSSKEEILENMNSNLKEVIEKSQGKTITDVGCGCGRNLVYSSNLQKLRCRFK